MDGMGKDALVICAHSDDQILGVGGTMANLSDQGYDITTVIMSYGELSHPHLKPSSIRDVRQEESERANEIIGGGSVEFIDLPEGEFTTYQNKARKHIKALLEQENPDLVFTHSPDDLHHDHRETHQLVLDIYDSLETIETDIYVFDVWTLWNLAKRDWPRLYVDISKTFSVKIEALHEFTSQISLLSHTVLNNYVYLKQYVTAFVNGMLSNHGLAEVFYKVR